MAVRVIHAQPQINCDTGEYLAVRSSPDPYDADVTLVTVQRFVEKTRVNAPSDESWHVKTLILDQRMSQDAALGFATRYAERKHIPVVYSTAS